MEVGGSWKLLQNAERVTGGPRYLVRARPLRRAGVRCAGAGLLQAPGARAGRASQRAGRALGRTQKFESHFYFRLSSFMTALRHSYS